MRKVKIGKRTAVVAAILVLCVGLAYGAIVNYLSNVIEKTVDVASPIDLSGTITYKAAGYEDKTETFEVLYDSESFATITKTDDLTGEYVTFRVDFHRENPSGNAYHVGLVIATSTVAPDFQVWMRDEDGNWYYEDYRAAPLGWTGNPEPEGKGIQLTLGQEYEGITVEGESSQMHKVIKISISRLGGEGAVYYWAMQVRTNLMAKYPESWECWSGDVSGYAESTVGKPVFSLDTESFNGEGVSVQLKGGDEFSMSFEAKNLANNLVEAPLALVMTCPGGWTEGSLYPITLSSIGDGTAEWSAKMKTSGYYSAKLCVEDGAKDWAEVSIPVDIPLNQINQLTFLKKVVSGTCSWNPDAYPCGWNPNVILAIDADGDGDFDGDLPSYHFQGSLGSDAFIEGEFPTGLTEYDTDFEFINAIEEMAWWGADEDGILDALYGSLETFQTQSWGKIDPTDHVKYIKIVIGGTGSWTAETAYVDDVTINEETVDLEPRVLEILEINPAPYQIGLSSNGKLVMVFDELDTIGPGATKELSIRMKLASNAEEGEYTIKALVVWEGAVEDFNAIASAAELP